MAEKRDENTVNETVDRDEDFGLGDFKDMLNAFANVLHWMVPDVEKEVYGNHSREEVKVDIHLEDPNDAGLVLGSKMSNLALYQRFLRAQQVWPHNRFVKIVLHKGPDEDAETQVFVDRKVSSRKKQQSDNGTEEKAA